MTCMAHDHATVAEEEYLQTIFWLQEAGLQMTGANVARAMQLSAPTVHEMIGRLERDGDITRGSDTVLAFAETGREHAAGIGGFRPRAPRRACAAAARRRRLRSRAAA